jgi:hypothetical protein
MHGLAAVLDVYDGKTAVAEHDVAIDVYSIIVGAAMGEPCHHGFHDDLARRPVSRGSKRSADSTHDQRFTTDA